MQRENSLLGKHLKRTHVGDGKRPSVQVARHFLRAGVCRRHSIALVTCPVHVAAPATRTAATNALRTAAAATAAAATAASHRPTAVVADATTRAAAAVVADAATLAADANQAQAYLRDAD